MLPELLDVVDDPLQGSYAGKGLVGAYKVDDEGVAARKVELVTKGKLVSYLTDRTPIRDFPVSDGHGRAAPGQAAHARAGVMIFSGVNPLSAPDLHAKLLALAKEQGKDVYEVENADG